MDHEQFMAHMSVDHVQLVQAMGDAVVVADVDGKISLWNPAATRIFGFTEEEAMGRPLDLVIPERQRARHNEGYARTIATGTTRYGTALLRVPARHKDGRRLSIAFTVALLTGERGQVLGVAAVIRDETLRFQEEQALRNRLTELEAAAHAADTSRRGGEGVDNVPTGALLGGQTKSSGRCAGSASEMPRAAPKTGWELRHASRSADGLDNSN